MLSPEHAPEIYSAADVNIIPLVKDVYRTALPSKTATCLACGKPIIFAIGKNTKMEGVLSDIGCYFTDSNNTNEIKNAIHDIKRRGYRKINQVEVYTRLFSISKNSKLYSDIITDM